MPPVGNPVLVLATELGAMPRVGQPEAVLPHWAADLFVALLGHFLFVTLGVLGCADLASLGVDACATLSFAFHDFACGFGGHYVSRCDNDLGAVL